MALTDEFHRVVEELMKVWKVPGLSVAVVDEDKIDSKVNILLWVWNLLTTSRDMATPFYHTKTLSQDTVATRAQLPKSLRKWHQIPSSMLAILLNLLRPQPWQLLSILLRVLKECHRVSNGQRRFLNRYRSTSNYSHINCQRKTERTWRNSTSQSGSRLATFWPIKVGCLGICSWP